MNSHREYLKINTKREIFEVQNKEPEVKFNLFKCEKATVISRLILMFLWSDT